MEHKKPRKKDRTTGPEKIDESAMFEHVADIVENRKGMIERQVNMHLTMMYWEIGHFINSIMLDGVRGQYGKQVLAKLSPSLAMRYGRGFELTNIYRMMRFAQAFADKKLLETLSQSLSWSHIVELLPLKDHDARLYYAMDVAERRYGVRELRRQISRKAYENRKSSNAGLSEDPSIPFNAFMDPYTLDILGLKDNFLENDLENAILVELEAFILET